MTLPFESISITAIIFNAVAALLSYMTIQKARMMPAEFPLRRTYQTPEPSFLPHYVHYFRGRFRNHCAFVPCICLAPHINLPCSRVNLFSRDILRCIPSTTLCALTTPRPARCAPCTNCLLHIATRHRAHTKSSDNRSIVDFVGPTSVTIVYQLSISLSCYHVDHLSPTEHVF